MKWATFNCKSGSTLRDNVQHMNKSRLIALGIFFHFVIEQDQVISVNTPGTDESRVIKGGATVHGSCNKPVVVSKSEYHAVEIRCKTLPGPAKPPIHRCIDTG